MTSKIPTVRRLGVTALGLALGCAALAAPAVADNDHLLGAHPISAESAREQAADASKIYGAFRVLTTTLDSTGRPVIRATTANTRARAADLLTRQSAAPGVVAIALDGTSIKTAGTLRPLSGIETASTNSNDEYRSFQWGLDALQGEKSWESSAGDTDRRITVAVIDTGVDPQQEDLAGRLTSMTAVQGETDTTDLEGHGTAVAGIIAATANNGIGIAGLANKAGILSIRVFDSAGVATNMAVANAITMAVDSGARVINLSLSSHDPAVKTTLQPSLTYAAQNSVIVVAASGNDGETGSTISYPAGNDGVIGVGSVDDTTLEASTFSTRNNSVDVSAPGKDIAVTGIGNTYLAGDGTSFAASFVSAEAAQLRSVALDHSAQDISDLIARTASDLGVVGRDDSYGTGLINPVLALKTFYTNIETPAPAASVWTSTTRSVGSSTTRVVKFTAAPFTKHNMKIWGWTPKSTSPSRTNRAIPYGYVESTLAIAPGQTLCERITPTNLNNVFGSTSTNKCETRTATGYKTVLKNATTTLAVNLPFTQKVAFTAKKYNGVSFTIGGKAVVATRSASPNSADYYKYTITPGTKTGALKVSNRASTSYRFYYVTAFVTGG